MVNFKEYITKYIGEEKAKRDGVQWREKHENHTHICKDIKYNFLNGQVPVYCDLKGSRCKGKKIHYHRWSKCLTSSQVMCISFFKKFFEVDENLLLELLKQCGLKIDSSVYIRNAIFEYEPDSIEKTNFDFYLELSNNHSISFEIKYTEQEFGGISISKEDPEKYVRKWNSIYKKMVDECPYFVEKEQCQQNVFYQQYQISRNIAHAKNEGDIVVFLTPRENQNLDKGRKYIEEFNNENIVNLYWEDVLEKLDQMIEDSQELKVYYNKFRNKYYWFNIMDN